jgi:hypothetical protein
LLERRASGSQGKTRINRQRAIERLSGVATSRTAAPHLDVRDHRTLNGEEQYDRVVSVVPVTLPRDDGSIDDLPAIRRDLYRDE